MAASDWHFGHLRGKKWQPASSRSQASLRHTRERNNAFRIPGAGTETGMTWHEPAQAWRPRQGGGGSVRRFEAVRELARWSRGEPAKNTARGRATPHG